MKRIWFKFSSVGTTMGKKRKQMSFTHAWRVRAGVRLHVRMCAHTCAHTWAEAAARIK